jgi:hypothetical protein
VRIGGHETPNPERRAGDIVDIFDNHRRAGNDRSIVVDEHRRATGRVERPKLRTAFGHALSDKSDRNAVLTENKAHETRLRTERMMMETGHRLFRLRGGTQAVGLAIRLVS